MLLEWWCCRSDGGAGVVVLWSGGVVGEVVSRKYASRSNCGRHTCHPPETAMVVLLCVGVVCCCCVWVLCGVVV